MSWPIEGDLVLGLRRTLMPHEFVPKTRTRLGRVVRLYDDGWGNAMAEVAWFPLAEGEEEMVGRFPESDRKVEFLERPDPVEVLAHALDQ